MREGFLVDPAIAYLNHGSYGACPRPVFDEYQRFQRELEHVPVDLELLEAEVYCGHLPRQAACAAAEVEAGRDDEPVIMRFPGGSYFA